MLSQLLTVAEVQQRLRVSRACVYTLIQTRRLPSVRIGVGRGTIRVLLEDLEAFVAASRSPRSETPKPTRQGATFVHLDGQRLQDAWSPKTKPSG